MFAPYLCFGLKNKQLSVVFFLLVFYVKKLNKNDQFFLGGGRVFFLQKSCLGLFLKMACENFQAKK